LLGTSEDFIYKVIGFASAEISVLTYRVIEVLFVAFQ